MIVSDNARMVEFRKLINDYQKNEIVRDSGDSLKKKNPLNDNSRFTVLVEL